MNAHSDFLIASQLTLEPQRQEHAEAMFNGLIDRHLYEFIPDHPPASVDVLRARYKKLEARVSPDGGELWLNWVVRQNDTAALIGYVQATVRKHPAEGAVIGYVIFADYWGRGLAKQAIQCMVDFLFSQLNVPFIESYIDTRNLRSVRTIESLGFSRCEFLHKAAVGKARTDDEFKYMLSRRHVG